MTTLRTALGVAAAAVGLVMAAPMPSKAVAAAPDTQQFGYQCRYLYLDGLELSATDCLPLGGAPAHGRIGMPFFVQGPDLGERYECQSGFADSPRIVLGDDCYLVPSPGI